MAKYRPPEYCPNCGKQLQAQYQDQSNTPVTQRLIGDTFIGYKPCECTKASPNPTLGIDVEELAKEYANKKQIDRWVYTMEQRLKFCIEDFKAGYAASPQSKELQRIIELLKIQVKSNCECKVCTDLWEQFKTENNL